ncbi:MAG: DNA-processing protein DprA [Dethiosulfatibacter sp.]|nr:DNA-processing protein DprA [Dethiosulfatibacter sp.]
MNNLTKNLVMLNCVLGPNNRLIEEIDNYISLGDIDNPNELLEALENCAFVDEKKTTDMSIFIKQHRIDFFLEYMDKENIKVCTVFDNNFPERLRLIDDNPFILYYKGSLQALEGERMLSVVGSRKATSYGKWVAESFVSELCGHGFSIVSGLAYGIDSVAHQTALKNNQYTSAVLGCGIDVIYPKRNKDLYSDISERGSIISEFAPGFSPLPFNFPYRNRVISGLSDAILVVEAGEKSGTLITATYGFEQNKEVFAIPGNIDNINARGTNRLIREGAKITTCVDDILEEFSVNVNGIDDSIEKNEILNDIQVDIINSLKHGEKSIVEIYELTGHLIADLNSNLTVLELRGVVSQGRGKQFRLNRIKKVR